MSVLWIEKSYLYNCAFWFFFSFLFVDRFLTTNARESILISKVRISTHRIYFINRFMEANPYPFVNKCRNTSILSISDLKISPLTKQECYRVSSADQQLRKYFSKSSAQGVLSKYEKKKPTINSIPPYSSSPGPQNRKRGKEI